MHTVLPSDRAPTSTPSTASAALSSTPPMPPAPVAPMSTTPWRALRQALRSTFSWRPLLIAGALALGVALALRPIYSIPFAVLLGRTVFVAALLLLAFGVAGAWQSSRMPRWVAQLIAVVVMAPVATLVAYLPSTGGSVASIAAHEGRMLGYVFISGAALMLGPLFALAALYRERDAQARAAQLAFALERTRLEKQALDARLSLLNAQIEPHFLFNTLANVQALVESGSPQAPAVLKSLIAYLRAAVPQLHQGAPTLGREMARVKAYLELMRLRMPDRLAWSLSVPDDLDGVELVPLSVLTLVENAVRHGIDPSEEGGRIDVSVARDPDGRVRIVVADTGLGMPENATRGTGLTNLEARLRGRHGESARLDLHDAAPHGVRAEIALAPA